LDRITDKSINKSIYFHLNSQIKQYQSLNNDKDKKLLEDYITQIYNAYRFYPYFKKIILVTPNYSWDTTLTKAKRKEIILNLIKNENLPWKNETQNFLANLLQY